MEQEYVVRGGQRLCRLGEWSRSNDNTTLGLVMRDCGDNLLHSVVPDRPCVFFALNDETKSSFCRDDIGALVMRSLRHFSLPVVLLQKRRTVALIFVAAHVFDFVPMNLIINQYGLMYHPEKRERHEYQPGSIRPEQRGERREDEDPDRPDA